MSTMISEDFEENVHMLNTTLRDSMERLLMEAKGKNALLPPYGRPPTPTPFVDDDEEIVQDLDLNDEEAPNDDDTVTNFKYEYGFNPLVFLAEYLQRAHPDTIAQRQQQKEEAKSTLRRRAAHAMVQMNTAENLKVRAFQLRRTVSSGNVVIELSHDISFSTIYRNASYASDGPEVPMKVVLEDLEAGTKYYCRCHLEEKSEESSEMKPFLAYCHFWTLVDSSANDDATVHQEVEIFAINGQTRRRLDDECGPTGFHVKESDITNPFFTVLVGDIFDNGCGVHEDDVDLCASPESFDTQLWKLFRYDPMFFPLDEKCDYNSVLSMSSMLCAWNDSQKGSDTGLKAEEIVHKQWSYDTRKFEKRQKERLEKDKKEAFEQKGVGASAKKRSIAPPPVLSRPEMSIEFSKLAKELPLQYTEDNVRHFYRSFHIGPDVEVFVLDSRDGYLGKEQARWLKDSIRKGSSTMKVIFSGQNFGFPLVDKLRAVENDNITNDEIVALDEEVNQVDGQKEDGELALIVSESIEQSSENEVRDENLSESPSSNSVGKTTPVKKVSSSRKKALEAAKEEFDEDGLSKSSLAHVLVSTHRKLYPLHERVEDDTEYIDECTSPVGSQTDSDSKLELSGGILIVSSSGTEESFVASYNFGRSIEELEGDNCFCLEVGLGCAQKGTNRQISEEKSDLTPAESLVANGRKILYRSSCENDDGVNVNAVSCSITVKANSVLDVSMKQVDTGATVFNNKLCSALSV